MSDQFEFGRRQSNQVRHDGVVSGVRFGRLELSERAVVCAMLMTLAVACIPFQVFYFCKEGTSCRLTTAIFEVAVTAPSPVIDKSESVPESNAADRSKFGNTSRLDFGARAMQLGSLGAARVLGPDGRDSPKT